MSKKYRITSRFRFTVTVLIAIICIITITGSLLGFNTVNSASMNQYHQVKIEAGDTIWDIASEYTSDDMDVRKVVYDICQINDTSPEQLTAGDRIIVPVYQ